MCNSERNYVTGPLPSKMVLPKLSEERRQEIVNSIESAHTIEVIVISGKGLIVTAFVITKREAMRQLFTFNRVDIFVVTEMQGIVRIHGLDVEFLVREDE